MRTQQLVRVLDLLQFATSRESVLLENTEESLEATIESGKQRRHLGTRRTVKPHTMPHLCDAHASAGN